MKKTFSILKIILSFFKTIFYPFILCFKSKYKLYRITALISVIIRFLLTTFLPNPIEPIVTNVTSLWHWSELATRIVSWLILLFLDNYLIVNIMHFTSFATVGNFYKARTDGSFGSLCYLAIYCFQYISLFLGIRWFEWYTIIPLLFGYALICGVLYSISGTKIKPRLRKVAPHLWLYDYKQGYTLPDTWIFRLILHIILFVIFAAGIIAIKILFF